MDKPYMNWKPIVIPLHYRNNFICYRILYVYIVRDPVVPPKLSQSHYPSTS